MAKLTAAARKKLPASDFALGKGHYPIEDKKHARLALAAANGARTGKPLPPEKAAKVRFSFKKPRRKATAPVAALYERYYNSRHCIA